MRRVAVFFVALFLTDLTFAAETKISEDMTQRRINQELAVAVSVITKSLDPRASWHNVHFLLQQLFNRTLVRLDPSGQVQADLAKSWTISPDGLSYVFKLSTSAKFQDGTPVQSEDVAYSLSRHFWPGSPSIVKDYFEDILTGNDPLKPGQMLQSFSTPDHFTFIIKLRQRYPQLLELLAIPSFGVIKRGSGESAEPIGSGIMGAQHYPSEEQWIFRHLNPGPESLRTISIKYFKDDEGVLQALERKEIDLALGFSGGDTPEVSIVRPYKRVRANTPGTMHFYVNDRSPLLKSSEFRRALLGLLHNALAKVKDPGFFLEPQATLLPRGLMPASYYQRKVPDISPEEFVKRWGRQTKNQTLKVIVRKEFLSPAAASAIHDALSKTGFNLQFSRKMISEAMEENKSGNYDLIMGSYLAVIPYADWFLALLSPTNPVRYGRFPTDDLLRSIREARFSASDEERRLRYAESIARFEEEAYVLPLFQAYFALIAHEDLILPEANFRYVINLSKIKWKKT